MKIYKLREVCSILDISEGTFYLWVKKEYIPKPLKNRRGHNVYTEDLLIKAQKYIEEMEYTLADISHEEEPVDETVRNTKTQKEEVKEVKPSKPLVKKSDPMAKFKNSKKQDFNKIYRGKE